MSNILEMGGYASFVWPSFGISFVVLAGLLIFSLRALKVREIEVEKLENQVSSQRPENASDASMAIERRNET